MKTPLLYMSCKEENKLNLLSGVLRNILIILDTFQSLHVLLFLPLYIIIRLPVVNQRPGVSHFM